MSSNQIYLQDERRKLMKEILDLYDPNNEGYVNSKDTSKILKAMGRTLEDDDEQNFLQAADPEETGKISIAIEGTLNYNLSLDDARMILIEELKPKKELLLDDEFEEESEANDNEKN